MAINAGMANESDILIIGAGAAGLAAARELYELFTHGSPPLNSPRLLSSFVFLVLFVATDLPWQVSRLY